MYAISMPWCRQVSDVQYLMYVTSMPWNRYQSDVRLKDKDGRTALLWASFCGHSRILKTLIRANQAMVGVPDRDGRTALYVGHTPTYFCTMPHPRVSRHHVPPLSQVPAVVDFTQGRTWCLSSPLYWRCMLHAFLLYCGHVVSARGIDCSCTRRECMSQGHTRKYLCTRYTLPCIHT